MNRYRCVKPRALACALLFWPLMASAADSALVQGYCGPLPPNSWFQFSSSTVPAVQAQLLSTLTARAFSIYDVAVPKYVADYITPAGCTAQVTPRPGTYCTSPLDCTAQIDGEIRVTCGGQSSTPFLNTFAIERGGCWAEPAPNSAPKKVVVLDPGHGFTCTAKRMPGGAIGITDFPPNDPPAGRLREDDLTMAIASEVRRILPTSMYRVELTKANANECPSYRERARIANKEEAKAFVSIHINAPLVVPGINVPIPAAHGTSVLYNVNKSGAFNLAYAMAGAVSSSLGVNNRGAMVNDDLAVLKENYTETGIAVLLEAARLSGDDERKLHASGSATRIANGIKAALDASLGN